MIQKILFILCFLSASFYSKSQNFGNEWIDYDLNYFKFPISQTGLKRIDYATLVTNGISTTGINPSSFQLFAREKEVPIFMFDNNDNSFDPGDFFVFLGKKNDGSFDSILQFDQSHQANPEVSLISDTIYYFFTIEGTNGLRYTEELNQNFALFDPVTHLTDRVKSNYTGAYAIGKLEGLSASSFYAPGEGYGYGEIAATTSNAVVNYGIPTKIVYTGADASSPKISYRLTSNSNALITGSPINNHHTKLEFGALNSLLIDTVYSGYAQIKGEKTLTIAAISSGVSYLQHTVVSNIDDAVDRQILTYHELEYPRTVSSNGAPFDVFFAKNILGQLKLRVDLQSLNCTSPLAFGHGQVFSMAKPTFDAGVWKFILPRNETGEMTEIFLYDSISAVPITSLQKVNSNGKFRDFSMIPADSVLLMVYHQSLEPTVSAYENYRKSISGGGFNAVKIDVEEVYNQFGAGIRMHPGGIRNLVRYFDSKSTSQLAGLFLIGKGIGINHHRFSIANSALNLVPTFGYPSSDNAITSHLNGSDWEPLLPTGRITVSSSAALQDYLDKIIQYENKQSETGLNIAAESDYQKQILHFVGGQIPSQQATFQSFMNDMADVAEDTLMGANVTSFFKTSSAPLDPNIVEGVTELIEGGVSLMNFFSHAAASNNGFEVNIDEPSNWNNSGKYPIVIGNSCYNGNIFHPTLISTSQRFVDPIQEGAIAFVSSVETGYDLPLYQFSLDLYRQFSYKSYGSTFGKQLLEAGKHMYSIYNAGYNSNLLFETAVSQMALNGDPMITVNVQGKPEIHLENSFISISPENINLGVDTVEIAIAIKNLGKSITSPIYVELRRDFPGTNIDSLYQRFLPNLNYADTIRFQIPVQAEIAAGLNTFTVNVDLPTVFPEEFEEISNNTASASFFFNIDGINPIWPYNFAVVPYDTVTVKASTINPLAGLNTYRFELDTTDLYNSPQFRTFTLSELGGVKEVNFNAWKNNSGTSFPLICQDSMVYFWRVSVDSAVYNWSEFSFQYIQGKTGWGQDHFFQFKNNDFFNLEYDRVDRLRKFPIGEEHSIYIRAYDSYSVYNQWGVDGDLTEYAHVLCPGSPGIYVGVLDPITLEPWGTYYGTENSDHQFGNQNQLGVACSRARVEKFFAFNQNNPSQMLAFENMIENEIPNGYYVSIYTTFSTNYTNWTATQPSLYSMFGALGSTLVNAAQPEKPFAMIFKKGDPSSLVEKHYPDLTIDPIIGNHVFLEKTFLQNPTEGIEETPFIGPAFDWGNVYWRRDSLEMVQSDTLGLRIKTYDINHNFLNNIDLPFTPNDSLINLNATISATTAPYIRLSVFNKDFGFTTPGQVDRLHVLYSPVPEAAIDGTNGFYTSLISDTVSEGQTIAFAVDIKNISVYPMDSILIKYWIEDQFHSQQIITYPRKDSLRVFQTFRDTISFSTLNLAGYNVLWTEVNPYINGSTLQTDQLEQYHFNNYCQLPFFVVGDDLHPILDVTFNGKHILNGDIIDPNQEIQISLRDDNPFLIMDNISDTTLFGVYITNPAGELKRIPFMNTTGDIVMDWVTADAGAKKFKIMYPRFFDKDGIYELMVQAADRSGNLSGDNAYKVKFEIIHESSITSLMNYPNPFSSSTRFVFTLTGSEKPDNILIQIMNINGKVVREIHEEEIGEINIGRNITEFAWDGKDEFGDQLANGVYLYRVKVQLNGQNMKHLESDGDQYFENNFGKMYLMR